MSKKEFENRNNAGNPIVIRFISDFLFCCSDISIQLMKIYTEGYCYYFAKMLLDTFQRGRLVVDREAAHVAWKDVDGKIYDITGFRKTGNFESVPDSYFRKFTKAA